MQMSGSSHLEMSGFGPHGWHDGARDNYVDTQRDRPESITRCAASARYSAVNFLRPVDMTTSLLQPLSGCLVGVYFFWGTSTTKYPEQIAFLRENYGFRQAYATTGSGNSKTLG